MGILQQINKEQLKSQVPAFKAGDTIRVHQLIQEGSKERVQVFEGVVICRNGGGVAETFTVRKVSYNVGVERVYPLHSPRISKIEVKQKGKVRRARLYYLRDLSGKAARIQQARYNADDKDRMQVFLTPEEEAALKQEQVSPAEDAAPEEAGA